MWRFKSCFDDSRWHLTSTYEISKLKQSQQRMRLYFKLRGMKWPGSDWPAQRFAEELRDKLVRQSNTNNLGKYFQCYVIIDEMLELLKQGRKVRGGEFYSLSFPLPPFWWPSWNPGKGEAAWSSALKRTSEKRERERSGLLLLLWSLYIQPDHAHWNFGILTLQQDAKLVSLCSM